MYKTMHQANNPGIETEPDSHHTSRLDWQDTQDHKIRVR